MLRIALERRGVGQHRQAGRAARLIAAGELRRLEISRIRPSTDRLLDLGDQPEPSRLDRTLERLDEAARRRLVADPAHERAARHADFRFGDLASLVGLDLLQDVGHTGT